MKKMPAFLFSVLLLSSLNISAQKNVSVQIDTLLARSERLLDLTQTDSALNFAFRAAVLSQRFSDANSLARSYLRIAETYDQSNEADLSVTYLLKADDAARNTSDQKLKTEILVNLAYAFFNKGNYDEALSSSRKAQSKGEKLNDNDLLYRIYIVMGNLYLQEEIRNPDSSAYYINKSLVIALEKKDTLKIAETYRNLNDVYVERKQWDEALVYLNKALDFYDKKNNTNGLMYTYKNIGDIYYYTRENKKSLEYYMKSYDLSKKRENISIISTNACDLAY